MALTKKSLASMVSHIFAVGVPLLTVLVAYGEWDLSNSVLLLRARNKFDERPYPRWVALLQARARNRTMSGKSTAII